MALADEAASYDADELIRAAESVLSPVCWRERRIRRYLADRTNASLRRYADTVPE